MWLRKIQDRSQTFTTRRGSDGIRPMTRMQVVRALRMRHYAWGKPFQTIADETGLTAETIRSVIGGQPFSVTTWAVLVGYPRTPQGQHELTHHKATNTYWKPPRRPHI